MTAWERFISVALVHSLWQGAIIAFVLSILLIVFRRSDPRVRYALSCMAMLVLIAWPILSVTNVAEVVSRSTSRSNAIERWVPFVWSWGVCIWSLRLALGYRKLRGLRSSGAFMEDEILARVKDRVRFLSKVRAAASPLVEVPCAVGFLRPVILIPASILTNLPIEHVEALLAHEIAHLKRWDHWVNLAQCCIQALLFYHPAAWWISKRIREERELCCDDLVVRAYGDAVTYAKALTALEKLRVHLPEAALLSTEGSLAARIQRLAGINVQLKLTWAPLFVGMTVLVAMLPLPQNRVEAQTSATSRTAPSQSKAPTPAPVKPQAKARPQPTTRTEVRAQVSGALDAESYAKAERELVRPRPISNLEIDRKWQTALYDAGWEYGAHHFFFGSISSGQSEESPEYASMQRNLRKVTDLVKKYQAASTPEEKLAQEPELSESLAQLQKDIGVLREIRTKASQNQNR